MFFLFAVFLLFRFLLKIFDFLLYTSLGDLYILNPLKWELCMDMDPQDFSGSTFLGYNRKLTKSQVTIEGWAYYPYTSIKITECMFNHITW